MKSFRSALNFACVAIPKLVGGACLVALNIFLIKWIGPDTYGVYAICLAALSLLSEGLFGAAIDMGVIRLAPLHLLTDPIRSLKIERAALELKLMVVGGLSLFLTLVSVPLSHLVFQRTGDWYLIVITCAASLGALCFTSVLLHFQIRGLFWRYGVLDAVQTLVKFGGIALLICYVSTTKEPLRLGQVMLWFAIGPFVGCTIFLLFSKVSLRSVPIDVGHRSRSELLGYIKWYLCTLIVSSIIARTDVFALTAFCPIKEVGLYAAGQTIAMIPVLLGLYLSVVFSPKIMPYCRDGNFLALLWRVQGALIMLSILGYSVLLWNGQFFTRLLLPSSFAPSSQVIFILFPASLAGMTSFPLVVSFLMFVRPKFLVTVDLILLPFLLLAYALAIPRHGAIGAAVVTSVFGVLKTCVAQLEAFRMAGKSPTEMGIAAAHDDGELEAATSVNISPQSSNLFEIIHPK